MGLFSKHYFHFAMTPLAPAAQQSPSMQDRAWKADKSILCHDFPKSLLRLVPEGPTASNELSRSMTTASFRPGGSVDVAFCQVRPPSVVITTFSPVAFSLL